MAKPNEPVSRKPKYPLTVTVLAQTWGLSRSTLLHYDRVGLVCPSARSPAGYRLYAEPDAQRLARVVELRATGMSLEHIHAALDHDESVVSLLRQQAEQLTAQIQSLHAQQDVLELMLSGSALASRSARLDKQGWTDMFRAAGLSEAQMLSWHREFERSRPQAHRVFLASLGIPSADIARIRRRARG